MGITQIYIENFKGVGTGNWIKIKPITIFIGANSSGKSTCVHAIACLSQTLKVPNNSTPLVLDDEFANVHLGRFIEVIHSKSYQDYISLGLKVSGVPLMMPDEAGKTKHETSIVEVEAKLKFKCSQRTQDVRLHNATIKVGDYEYTINDENNCYVAKCNKIKSTMKITLGPGFLIRTESLFKLGRNDFIHLFPLISAQAAISSELTKTLYLGPFRESPRRKYETRGASPVEVGPRGESAITMLANESLTKTKRHHIMQISGWLDKLGLANNVKIKRVGKSDLVDLQLSLSDGESFPIADLGYGLSQIMPVLTQCSFAQNGSTLLFEQPEIHLHTKSSKDLATVFIDTVKSKKSTIILETHSPDLVKQFMVELRNGNLSADDFILYKVFRDGSETHIREIEIDIDNNFDVYENWESGISI